MSRIPLRILTYKKTHFLLICGIFQMFLKIHPSLLLVNKLLTEHLATQLDTPMQQIGP